MKLLAIFGCYSFMLTLQSQYFWLIFMGFGLGIEEVDCLFESRSSTGGVVFWAPPFPLPPSAQGSGFPPGVRASPRGQGPPGVRTSRPASRLLPSFQLYFPGTGGQGPRLHALLPGCQGQAFRPQVSGHPPCFPLLSGDRASSMLSGGHAFRRFSGGHASRGPGIFELFFFAASAPFVFASQPPGFQEARGQTSPPQASGVHAFRGPGTRGQGPGLPALTSHTLNKRRWMLPAVSDNICYVAFPYFSEYLLIVVCISSAMFRIYIRCIYLNVCYLKILNYFYYTRFFPHLQQPLLKSLFCINIHISRI